MNYKFIFYLLAFSILFNSSIYAQRTKSSLSAGEQRHAEKGLKDNRYFFYFINSSISNLGSEEDKRKYKEAIQRDIIAQILYMKFLFHDSFKEIRKSQKILIGLYRDILKKDIKITKNLLSDFARSAIKTKDHKSQHYLKLGFRDVAVAKIYLTMADHYRETLYSMRLYKYVRAIKKAKHGKRYAFYSRIESKTSRENKIELRLLSFDKLDDEIKNLVPEKKDYFSLFHHDNYYKTKSGKSFYDQIWENPQLNEIEDYNNYLKMR